MRGARAPALRTALTAALLLALVSGPAGVRAEPRLSLAPDARPPAGLQQLSGQIAEIQQVMGSRFGIDTVYVVGGSARAVLDATYGYQKLAMRDLDLFAVSNTAGPGTRHRTDRLASQLTGLGYERHAVENRLRGNPALGRAGVNYNAGFGVFLRRPGQRTVVDLTLLHSPQDLQLNGPLNIDRIRIPIHKGETLVDVWRRMRGKPYQQVVRDGVVQDQSDGYVGWRTGKLRLVFNGDPWADVERAKPRLVKSFLKAGARMPAALVRQLRDTPQRRRRQPELELRYAKRVLDLPLPQATRGLNLLRQLRSTALTDPRLLNDPRYRRVHARPRRWPTAGKRPAQRQSPATAARRAASRR